MSGLIPYDEVLSNQIITPYDETLSEQQLICKRYFRWLYFKKQRDVEIEGEEGK